MAVIGRLVRLSAVPQTLRLLKEELASTCRCGTGWLHGSSDIEHIPLHAAARGTTIRVVLFGGRRSGLY
ncbi:hypothetical protein [Geminicoccus harenae]|uniref:hypothetical protein n=1 Tax=Geminicoccus harenae TaxID=2498453 RepID=UPI00168AB569|nr:hypothetical protein [Geminicoccus harenae]